MKRILIAGLVLMALFGAGLHWKAHPVVVPGQGVQLSRLLPNLFCLIDLVVVTALFLHRRTAALAFLLNGIIVIYGSVMMIAYTQVVHHPVGVYGWLLGPSLVPDVVAAWADFCLGAALWTVYVREGQALGARGVARRSLPRIRNEHLVVVGSGVAGVTAAEHARMTNPTIAITLVGDEPDLPYRRLRLTPYMARQETRESLLLRPRGWYRENRINLVTGCRMVGIDPQAHTLMARGLAGTMRYDRLVLATGAHPRRLPVERRGWRNVAEIRKLADAEAVLAAVEEGFSCVVIGGGLLGLETAKALALAGARVQVVEAMERILPRQLDVRGSERLAAALRREGLGLHLGQNVTAIDGADRATTVRLDGGVDLTADFVVVAVGVQSTTDLASLAGCQVERGVVVNDHLAATVEHIYAAGDAAQHRGVVYGIWPAAMDQGRVAGINAAGGDESYTGTVPFNPLKVVETPVYSVGVIAAEVPTDRELVLDTEAAYKKLIVRDGVLVGAVMVGDTTESEALAAAIVRRLDVSHESAGGDPRPVLEAVHRPATKT